jgi:hypothetical protein
MRSKNRLSVWFGAGLLILLCHQSLALAEQGSVDVKGNGTLGVTGVAFVPPGCNVGDNPCEANFTLTGKGFTNFTGPITLSAIEHVNLGVVVSLFGQGPSPLCFTAGLDTNETTANGDTLELIGVGSACFNGSDSIAFNGSWVIGVGSTGTGKFANALGTGTRVLVVDLTNRGIFTDTGAIQLKH